MSSHHKGKDIGVLQSAKIISYCTIVILAPDTVMHNLPCGRLHMISLGPVAGGNAAFSSIWSPEQSVSSTSWGVHEGSWTEILSRLYGLNQQSILLNIVPYYLFEWSQR